MVAYCNAVKWVTLTNEWARPTGTGFVYKSP